MSEAIIETVEQIFPDCELFWEPTVEDKRSDWEIFEDFRSDYRFLPLDEVSIPAAFDEEEKSIVLPLLQPGERHLLQELTDLGTPVKWRLSGVLPPSSECRMKAFEITKLLLREDEIMPRRVAASVEGGIALTYKHPLFDRSMILEVYNSLEAAGVVSEDEEVVYSEDIKDSQLSSIVKIFWLGSSAPADSRATKAARL